MRNTWYIVCNTWYIVSTSVKHQPVTFLLTIFPESTPILDSLLMWAIRVEELLIRLYLCNTSNYCRVSQLDQGYTYIYIYTYMTRSQINPSYECGKWMKVKVAKWCWKKWNGPFLMHIYDKQCEIMQKNQWKGPNFQIQCFYNERSLTDRSSLLKTGKTRETKT